jgi:ectoine hydroxylase-related dioxygenase (phytanoyl-CoA dioxygenase family)
MKGQDGTYVHKKLKVKARTLILMYGNLLHTSEANRSKKSRVAFILALSR